MMRALCGALLVLFAVGCGGGGDDGGGSTETGGGTGNNNGNNGVTSCGGGECQAGQYCWNGVCANGCLTNENCASNQVCEKAEGENEGTCQNTAPGKDCDSYVSQCTACGESQADCEAACAAESNACVECVIETGGCDAPFECEACE